MWGNPRSGLSSTIQLSFCGSPFFASPGRGTKPVNPDFGDLLAEFNVRALSMAHTLWLRMVTFGPPRTWMCGRGPASSQRERRR